MGIITRPYSEVSGTIAYASAVNRPIDDLYTLQAGSINSANIAGSGVGAANLETSAVVTRALDASSVTSSKISDNAVVERTVDGSVFILSEVFS